MARHHLRQERLDRLTLTPHRPRHRASSSAIVRTTVRREAHARGMLATAREGRDHAGLRAIEHNDPGQVDRRHPDLLPRGRHRNSELGTGDATIATSPARGRSRSPPGPPKRDEDSSLVRGEPRASAPPSRVVCHRRRTTPPAKSISTTAKGLGGERGRQGEGEKAEPGRHAGSVTRLSPYDLPRRRDSGFGTAPPSPYWCHLTAPTPAGAP